MTSNGYLEWLGQKQAEQTKLLPSLNRRSGDSSLAQDITVDVTCGIHTAIRVSFYSPCTMSSPQFTLYSTVVGPNGERVSIHLHAWRLTLNPPQVGRWPWFCPNWTLPMKPFFLTFLRVRATLKSIYLWNKRANVLEEEQKGPEFTKLNPNGRIPAIIDHHNNDFVIW